MLEINKTHNYNCLEGLKLLDDSSIDCCVTSPPYWGLRDYGVDDQLGLELTPEEYVDNMVKVFSEVKRVLKPEGTLWLNLGDTYYNYRGETDYSTKQSISSNDAHVMSSPCGKRNNKINNLKGKDLVGIPWMTAFALRADGWYLRQDIIWHKRNPMPESVTDRCTKSHEYIFLLAKSQKYFFNNEEIQEDSVTTGIHTNKKYAGNTDIYQGNHKNPHQGLASMEVGDSRNKRSVWTVNTKPYKDAHFAVYPEELIVDCIKAGCPTKGIVLDPFMGSGTTGVVARKLDRNFIGFELNSKYIKLSEKRLYNELGMYL
jgi:DNA modification methylase